MLKNALARLPGKRDRADAYSEESLLIAGHGALPIVTERDTAFGVVSFLNKYPGLN
jgi:hypothetical protein